jgi:hypothetical protein
MAVDPSNHPHVVWFLDDSPYKVFYSRHDGTSWTAPEIVDAGGSMGPSLAVDSAGDLHLTYYVGNVSYRKRVGGVWSAPTVIGSGGYGCVAVDNFGRPHAVWDVSPAEIYYSFFDGSSWSTPLNLSNNIGYSEKPSISCDSRSNLYVAWHDNSLDTTKFPRIFYRTFDGSSWSATSVISVDTINFTGWPNIGYPVTDSGVDVVWTQWYNNQRSVMYRRLPLVGSGVEGGSREVLKGGDLSLNVQNPIHRELQASLFLPVPSPVSLALYDISGRQLEVLDHAVHPSGRYEIKRLLDLPSGVYFLRLMAGSASLTRKVVVIR